MKPVLVTGAGGFLGAHIVRVLHARGVRVRATDLAGPLAVAELPSGVLRVPANLLDATETRRVVEGVSGIIHAAAIFDVGAAPTTLHRVNVLSTVTLATQAARAQVRRMVFVSSCDVYGDTDAPFADEFSEKRPKSAYAASKLVSEEAFFAIAAATALEAVALRPTAIYGPGSRYVATLLIGLPALLASEGVSWLPAPKNELRSSWVHVEDVARAAVHLLDAQGVEGRVFNVADDEPVSQADLVRLVAAEAGLTTSSVPFPAPLLARVARAGARIPRVATARLARALARRWSRVVEDNGLLPVLELAVDPGFFDYFGGERTFSNRALKETGFELAHPSMARAFPAVASWYREHRWIPSRAADARPSAAKAEQDSERRLRANSP